MDADCHIANAMKSSTLRGVLISVLVGPVVDIVRSIDPQLSYGVGSVS